MNARRLFAADALLPTGWARNVVLAWDEAGRFTAVTPDGPIPRGVPRAGGPVVAGMPNLHSHAFQRVFAGLTECRRSDHDSFWSWRETMYGVAGAVTPDQLEVIATWLYVEMLEAGYTSVCEFHYLHNDTDGTPYPTDATLALCLVRAAVRAGIGLTLLPVLYQTGGFGGVPATAGQRRFVRSVDSWLALAAQMKPACDAADARLGLALHSLRAVPPESLRDALAGAAAIDPAAPVHIHVAEQAREVDECVAWCRQRPVEWLLDHAPVDDRWCLVHATHMTRGESDRASRTGAVAGLCPTTEANLGDGIFDLPAWTDAVGPAGGRWGIGSDSHVTVNAAEELRMLEYSGRLRLGRRNVSATPAEPDVATAMTLEAVAGGAAASGRPIAGLRRGEHADFVVLDARHRLVAGLSAPQMLSAHVFASSRVSAVDAVWAKGQPVVVAGAHPEHESASRGFVKARAQLLASIRQR